MECDRPLTFSQSVRALVSSTGRDLSLPVLDPAPRRSQVTRDMSHDGDAWIGVAVKGHVFPETSVTLWSGHRRVARFRAKFGPKYLVEWCGGVHGAMSIPEGARAVEMGYDKCRFACYESWEAALLRNMDSLATMRPPAHGDEEDEDEDPPAATKPSAQQLRFAGVKRKLDFESLLFDT